MYGETFYGRHTAQYQLHWSQIKIRNEILPRVTCVTRFVLLAGGHVLFLENLPFSFHLTIDLARNEWNNPDGR